MLDGVLKKRSTSQEARSIAYGHHRVEKIKSKTIDFIPKKIQLHLVKSRLFLQEIPFSNLFR